MLNNIQNVPLSSAISQTVLLYPPRISFFFLPSIVSLEDLTYSYGVNSVKNTINVYTNLQNVLNKDYESMKIFQFWLNNIFRFSFIGILII